MLHLQPYKSAMKSRIILMAVCFAFMSCTKQTQIIQETISCYTDYDSISIELVNEESGEVTLLEPNSSNTVDFGELKNGSYLLNSKAYSIQSVLPTLELTRFFTIPMSTNTRLLSLPEPPGVEGIQYTVEDKKSYAFINLISSECIDIADGNIYTSTTLPVPIDEEHLAHQGSLTNDFQARVQLNDSVVYAVVEMREERSDRSFVVRTEPIRLERFGSSNYHLKLGEITEFDTPEGDVRYLTFDAEEGKYYMVDLYDNGNSNYSGSVLVVSALGHFSEARTAPPKGSGKPLKARKDGVITLNAAVAIGGARGSYGVRVNEIDMNQILPWDSIFTFDENASVKLVRRVLPAGTYNLKSTLVNEDSGMKIFYSLFMPDKNDGSYMIGPGVTGSNPIQYQFTLEQDEELLMVLNSAYHGTSNSIKFDLE